MPSLNEGILDSGTWSDVGDEKSMPARSRWQSYGNFTWVTHSARNFLSRFWPSRSSASAKNVHPTAYLDGLRGFAALLVYWHHHELWSHTGQSALFQDGFGRDGDYRFASIPGVRTFFTGGHYSVSTFFVISGYVLALKPLSLFLAGNRVGLGDHLASSIFRRWIRLYLPLFASVMVYSMSWHILGIWVRAAPQQPTWREELWALYTQAKNFSFVFNSGGDPWLHYNVHLWSIPLEFRGSMVIYASILAFSRCSVRNFLWCSVGLLFYFMYIVDGWYCAMFMSGLIICHLDLLSGQDELPSFLARLEPYKTFISYHMLALSIYLGGVPSENNDVDNLAKNRGWYYLSYLKPQAVFDYKWFYLFWAATLLVASVPRIRWLRRFFETSACQYLGRISYALYLVHGPVIAVVGDRLYLAAGWELEDESRANIPWWFNKMALPRKGPMGLELSFLLPHIILLPLTIFLAELVTRGIDGPSVRFASWVYRSVSSPEASPRRPSAKSLFDELPRDENKRS
ncbi:Acyltransferase family [Geosmithia morbida]|uniref:Acyltransferase family n=1 Tax=Geosmithia morbida TaxID=1094350 RepID=A0A9P5CZM4_9HYPO|nr:Acyltransferase family [Geosmithia morbida]KAF4120677.1 Acyltransferase family [Geosmithia morbida]